MLRSYPFFCACIQLHPRFHTGRRGERRRWRDAVIVERFEVVGRARRPHSLQCGRTTPLWWSRWRPMGSLPNEASVNNNNAGVERRLHAKDVFSALTLATGGRVGAGDAFLLPLALGRLGSGEDDRFGGMDAPNGTNRSIKHTKRSTQARAFLRCRNLLRSVDNRLTGGHGLGSDLWTRARVGFGARKKGQNLSHHPGGLQVSERRASPTCLRRCASHREVEAAALKMATG